MRGVLRESGARVLVRDYAAGDLAEERLDGRSQQLAPHFYVRGDGTRSFFFTPVRPHANPSMTTFSLRCDHHQRRLGPRSFAQLLVYLCALACSHCTRS